MDFEGCVAWCYRAGERQSMTSGPPPHDHLRPTATLRASSCDPTPAAPAPPTSPRQPRTASQLDWRPRHRTVDTSESRRHPQCGNRPLDRVRSSSRDRTCMRRSVVALRTASVFFPSPAPEALVLFHQLHGVHTTWPPSSHHHHAHQGEHVLQHSASPSVNLR